MKLAYRASNPEFAGIVADGAIAAIRLPPSLDGLHIKISGSKDRLSISTLGFRPQAETLDSDPLTFDVSTIENTGLVIALIRRGL